MSHQTLATLAAQILDDLAGAAYYADPALLADVLKNYAVEPGKAESTAKGILTDLLRRYARPALLKADKSEEVKAVIRTLEQHGLR